MAILKGNEMKLLIHMVCFIIVCFVAPRISCGNEPNENMDGAKPIEAHFAAYGLGTVLRVKVDPDQPDHGLAIIQMQENIGQEPATNRFVVVIDPYTTAPAFSTHDDIPKDGAWYLPLSQWPIDPTQTYFVQIYRRTNDYFLTSIDAVARWEEQQGLKAYLASGQLPKDKEKAEELNEELDSLRQEMSRILAGLDPNISDDDYFAVMGPLEKREKELSAEYFEVWSRMKYIPFNADIIGGAENAPVNVDENTLGNPEN